MNIDAAIISQCGFWRVDAVVFPVDAVVCPVCPVDAVVCPVFRIVDALAREVIRICLIPSKSPHLHNLISTDPNYEFLERSHFIALHHVSFCA